MFRPARGFRYSAGSDAAFRPMRRASQRPARTCPPWISENSEGTNSSDSSVDSNDAMDAGYDADASNDVSSDDSFDATDSAYNADASNDSSADSQATIVIGDSEDSVQFLYEVRPVGLTLVFAESVTFEPEVDGH